MSVNVNSITDSYNAWYDYKYGGNARGISASEISDIETRWKSNLKSWEAQAAKDENKYEISDDDFSSSKAQGKQNAKDQTGCSGKKGCMIARGAADAAVGVTGALIATKAGTKIAEKVSEKVLGKLINKTAEKVAKKAAEKAAKETLTKEVGKELAKKVGEKDAKNTIKETSKQIAENVAKESAGKTVSETAKQIGTQLGEEAGQTTAEAAVNQATTDATTASNEASNKASGGKSWIITAPLALAMGIAYQAKKPNKDEHEAAVQLRDDMLPNAQGDLSEAQAVMDEATDNAIELSEEANAANEDANEIIEENKTQFDQYRGALVELQEKAKSGEKLTDSEKELYQELVPSLQDLGEGIQETAEDVGEEVTDLRDDIGSYQSEYDSAADTIAEVQGLTDYAAGFDETAQIMTYVEAASQGLNALSGGKAAVDAGRFAASGGLITSWAWAFSAAGAAGAVMSGLGAAEQYKWAGDIGQEIDLREATQDFGSQTLDSYNEQIDIYDDNIAIVEDLEVEMPDDLEMPEEIPEMGETDSTADSPMLAQQEDDKKKDKEEKA